MAVPPRHQHFNVLIFFLYSANINYVFVNHLDSITYNGDVYVTTHVEEGHYSTTTAVTTMGMINMGSTIPDTAPMILSTRLYRLLSMALM